MYNECCQLKFSKDNHFTYKPNSGPVLTNIIWQIAYKFTYKPNFLDIIIIQQIVTEIGTKNGATIKYT